MKRPFVLFLVLSVAFRILFLLNVGLIDDEAYHWSWTQTLQLSYFDHPAMIAWLEWLSTQIFGNTVIGVRLPSFICYLGTLYLAWKIAMELFGSTAAQVVVALLLWTPFWGFGGYVSSPELPFIFCWLLAVWVFWQGVREDEHRWSLKKMWQYLGLVMGLGLNSKFIMALLAPGFGTYMMMTPNHRKDLLKRWPWIGILIATLVCLPIFIWNGQHDWPGFKYQFHDRHSGEVFSFARWLGWWGAQWALVSPVVYFMILVTLVRSYAERNKPQWRFLFALSVPSFVVFYPQPLFADYKPHWSGPAYLILCLGVGAIWAQGVTWRYKTLLAPYSKKVLWGTVGFLVFFNVCVYAPFAYPWVPKFYRAVNPQGQWNTVYDPSNEFFGWEELGAHLLRRQREIHGETGVKPFLAALRYETTAQTWWGTKEPVRMLNTPRSHYTIMQEFNSTLEPLKGSNALVVTPEKYFVDPMGDAFFDSCTPEEFKFFRKDELSRVFTIWYCKNFQGIKP